MNDYTPSEAKREDLMEDARAELQTDEVWNRHESHEGEYADPDTCWICREQVNDFLRFGEARTDDMIRRGTR